MNELMSVALLFVAIDWCVAGLLLLAAWSPPRVTALSERASAALAVAVVSSIGWWLLDNVRGGSPLPSSEVQLIGAVLIVAVSVPALWWLVQFFRGRFR